MAESPSYELGTEEATQLWVRVGSESTQCLDKLSLTERQAAENLADEAAKHHRLRGAWSVEHRMVCVQLLDTGRATDWGGGRVSVLPWGWAGGTFGGSLTLTVYLWGTEKEGKLQCRAAFPLGDPFLDIIRSGEFLVVVMHGKTVVRAARVDYSASEEGRRVIKRHVESIEEEGAKGYIDEAANFWETLHHHTTFDRYLSATDRLSLGWADRARAQASIRTILETFSSGSFGEVARKLPLDDLGVGLVEAVENCGGDFRVIRDFLLKAFDRDTQSVVLLFLEQFKDLPDDEEGDYPFTGLHAVMHTFFDCASITECGRMLPWFNDRGDLVLLPIEPHKFPEGIDPREYWVRQMGGIHFGWGCLLDGGDVPIGGRELQALLPAMPSCENPAECDQQANFLLAEADASKRGCIPPNAVVQLGIGPFVFIELRELGKNVYVALRQANGVVLFFTVEPHKEYCSAVLPYEEGEPASEDLAERVQAALKLLVAAVIRDFWVVETREAVFEQRTTSPSPRSDRSQHGPRIVYLPRVKYDHSERPDLGTCEEQLGVEARRSHFVAAHLRKSNRPSESQLALAVRYGFEVPEGYTFVRPHERGKAKRDVIYRSRSALRSLYAATDSEGETGEVDWFRFERDVLTLMSRLGFEVEHIAVSRHGDQGVDVFATKGVDLNAIQWVIQCKCWKAKRKVSPSVVRELVGTLASYPRGTRGMVVTTSSFTSGAVEEADRHGVRLMDGDEFARMLKELDGTETSSTGGP